MTDAAVTVCPECENPVAAEIVHHDCLHGLNVFASSGQPVFVAFADISSMPLDRLREFRRALDRAEAAMVDAVGARGISA